MITCPECLNKTPEAYVIAGVCKHCKFKQRRKEHYIKYRDSIRQKNKDKYWREKEERIKRKNEIKERVA